MKHKHQCGHEDKCRVKSHPQCVFCEIAEEPLDRELVLLYRARVIVATEEEIVRLQIWLNGLRYV
jgi:hypothetical protein